MMNGQIAPAQLHALTSAKNQPPPAVFVLHLRAWPAKWSITTMKTSCNIAVAPLGFLWGPLRQEYLLAQAAARRSAVLAGITLEQPMKVVQPCVQIWG
jgi:hypothetical protein